MPLMKNICPPEHTTPHREHGVTRLSGGIQSTGQMNVLKKSWMEHKQPSEEQHEPLPEPLQSTRLLAEQGPCFQVHHALLGTGSGVLETRHWLGFRGSPPDLIDHISSRHVHLWRHEDKTLTLLCSLGFTAVSTTLQFI